MRRRLFGDLLHWIGGRIGAQDPCASWTHLLSLYADAQATPQQAQRMEAHLASCASCRASLALLRATTQVASSWAAMEMPPGLSDRLSQAIADEARRQRVEELETSQAARRRFGLPQIAFSGAALFAVLFGGYIFTHNALTSHPYQPTVIADNPGHVPTALPGLGGVKSGNRPQVAAGTVRRHAVNAPVKTIVATVPREMHPNLPAPAFEQPGSIPRPALRSSHPQIMRPVLEANAAPTHENPVAHPRPHASGKTQIAKAVRPSIDLPSEPKIVHPEPEAAVPVPATTVAAAIPVATPDTPVVHLASTLKSLARSTQHIEPGTDQVSVALVRTANYTGAVTMVGSSIH